VLPVTVHTWTLNPPSKREVALHRADLHDLNLSNDGLFVLLCLLIIALTIVLAVIVYPVAATVFREMAINLAFF
jgi:hypothetical protein